MAWEGHDSVPAAVSDYTRSGVHKRAGNGTPCRRQACHHDYRFIASEELPSWPNPTTCILYDDSVASETPALGGFFHSCYLGAYFHSGWRGEAIWNIIEIDGLSMRQAISNWCATPVLCHAMCQLLSGADRSHVCRCRWNEGKAPAQTPATWSADCTWDHAATEPPKWSNSTCKDWCAKYSVAF